MTIQNTDDRQAQIAAAMDRAHQERSDFMAEMAREFIRALRDARDWALAAKA